MNLTKLSFRNTLYKPVEACLTVLVLSVSIGLLLAVQELDWSFKNQFEGSLNGIDMVVGAKGSPLQLVMASVLHIDNPTGNIPLKEADQIAQNPMVASAVPISYGDNYRGYRIVGSNAHFFDIYNATFKKGRMMEHPFEVVLGSSVAKNSQLKVGDTFKSSHGLASEGGHQHEQLMKVVGILSETHTVLDKLMVTPLESIWDIHHHHQEEEENHEEAVHHHKEHKAAHHHEEDEAKEITSLLVKFKSPMALLRMPRNINSNTNLQAALPKVELEKLKSYTGIGVQTITWIAYILLAISCLTFFVNLYKMVKEKSFELALLRTYGASTFQLLRMIFLEGSLVLFFSMLIGSGFSQLGIKYIEIVLNENYVEGISSSIPYQQFSITLFLFLVMFLAAVIVALIPLIRMNISKIISHEAL
ncbi:putative ABC transport system permease protein [Pustulibacterium marinum]|uniref:Putative ABC transport system permease protein n=2 Tax=Pustulibacterium marinum TaxID=1224947 RepID=A0A1I7ITA5_9FLAO|nr:putative ABC transport system permease protein [Pustulibacterium marinum]